jgi:hypothetical protein
MTHGIEQVFARQSKARYPRSPPLEMFRISHFPHLRAFVMALRALRKGRTSPPIPPITITADGLTMLLVVCYGSLLGHTFAGSELTALV